MMEIWTEDSTVGYKFYSKINKELFGRVYKVIPHRGAGEAGPTKSLIYGGILYHLKKLTTNQLVLLVIDKAIDRQETKDNYENVLREVTKHPNVFIVNQHCFEVCMLSYSKMSIITGISTGKLIKVANDFVNICRDLTKYDTRYFSPELREYIMKFSIDKMHSENISKSLLADVTSQPVLKVKYCDKKYTPALISGGKIGNCWVTDCCSLIPELTPKCKVTAMSSLHNKLLDIINNSDFCNVLKQIDDITFTYINNHYYIADSSKENVYKKLFEKAKGRYPVERYIVECIETMKYWNYERLYRKIR